MRRVDLGWSARRFLCAVIGFRVAASVLALRHRLSGGCIGLPRFGIGAVRPHRGLNGLVFDARLREAVAGMSAYAADGRGARRARFVGFVAGIGTLPMAGTLPLWQQRRCRSSSSSAAAPAAIGDRRGLRAAHDRRALLRYRLRAVLLLESRSRACARSC